MPTSRRSTASASPTTGATTPSTAEPVTTATIVSAVAGSIRTVSTSEPTIWTVTAATPPPCGVENGLSPGFGTGTTKLTDRTLATPSVVPRVATASATTGTAVSQRPLTAKVTTAITSVTGRPTTRAPT